MTPADTLRRLGACGEAVAWCEGKSPAVAWRTCQRSDWMLWLLARLRVQVPVDCICDIAAEATQYAGEDEVYACVWAIDAARRGASTEELAASRAAAWAASRAAVRAAAWAAACAAARAVQADIIREYVPWATVAKALRGAP